MNLFTCVRLWQGHPDIHVPCHLHDFGMIYCHLVEDFPYDNLLKEDTILIKITLQSHVKVTRIHCEGSTVVIKCCIINKISTHTYTCRGFEIIINRIWLHCQCQWSSRLSIIVVSRWNFHLNNPFGLNYQKENRYLHHTYMYSQYWK